MYPWNEIDELQKWKKQTFIIIGDTSGFTSEFENTVFFLMNSVFPQIM